MKGHSHEPTHLCWLGSLLSVINRARQRLIDVHLRPACNEALRACLQVSARSELRASITRPTDATSDIHRAHARSRKATSGAGGASNVPCLKQVNDSSFMRPVSGCNRQNWDGSFAMRIRIGGCKDNRRGAEGLPFWGGLYGAADVEGSSKQAVLSQPLALARPGILCAVLARTPMRWLLALVHQTRH